MPNGKHGRWPGSQRRRSGVGKTGVLGGLHGIFLRVRTTTNGPAEEDVRALDSRRAGRALAPNVLEVGGHQVPVETRRSIRCTEAEGLSRQLAGGFIVADRISTEARRCWLKAGWPGSIAEATCPVRRCGPLIDADVHPLIGPEPTRLPILASRRPGCRDGPVPRTETWPRPAKWQH